MKKMLMVVSFAVIAVSSPAYALYPYIGSLPISELRCNINRGSNTFSFIAHWKPLLEVKTVPDPTTGKPVHPVFIDPKTGKPWATYQVALRTVGAWCTLPNGGAVNCGGASECTILVTCPLKTTGASVHVVGTGIKSSSALTEGARKPADCK